MKRKSSIIGLIVGAAMTLSLVGCSDTEKAPIEESSATKVEQNNDKPKEEPKEEVKEEQKEEVVLVDDENIKIILTDKSSDIFGAGVNLIIENKLDKKIIVQSRETSVDGLMEDPIFSEEVMPGKKAKGMLQFMNITDVESLINIEGKLVLLDENFANLTSYDINIK